MSEDALAWRALALLAVAPLGLGGALLRAPSGPQRDAWMETLRAALPGAPPWRRMPPGIADARLIGGLDLAATLAAGRPVAEQGLLAQVDGGVLVVPMAERLEPGAAGHLTAALDTGEIVIERDGLAARPPARFACLLLDEGEGDEQAPGALAERVAFRLDLAMPRTGNPPEMKPALMPDEVAAARARLDHVAVGDDVIEAICAAGLAFGVPSLRVAIFALHAARAAAAIAGRDGVTTEDVALAAALVIAPRATRLPAEAPADAPDDEADRPDIDDGEPTSAPSEAEPDRDEADDQRGDPQNLADRVVEATRAAIPAGVLALLGLAAGAPRQAAPGRAGMPTQSARRGRPTGTRRGVPGHGARLALVETLRAAAPWQPLRRAAQDKATDARKAGRILVRQDDFRIARHKQRGETVTIFVVDASGSAALHRLAEVKGAVELILAECYVRRDSVALIAFRGAEADLILPPTRSLARAKRALAGQAGGGGTPLAAAILAATTLADGARRKGQTPLCVFLTDGKANVGWGQRRGRAEAEADADQAARVFRAGRRTALVLDIAPRPGDAALRLAAALGARYQPLPHADAHDLSRAVLDASLAKGDTNKRRNI